MDEPPQPRVIPFLAPSFSLERPSRRLEMNETIEVPNNYMSAISNEMHKIDLVNRLKESEPHNAAHYQEELEQQLVQHDDVIHRILYILKMDDYFRRTEVLPMIDTLTAYDDMQQFPEL